MESIWTDSAVPSLRDPLQTDLRTDAAIIGGGLAGILTAYRLKKRGIRAVVLEARRVGSGQTGRTTAKITSQHGLILSRLSDNLGEKTMLGYAAASEAAIRS